MMSLLRLGFTMIGVNANPQIKGGFFVKKAMSLVLSIMLTLVFTVQVMAFSLTSVKSTKAATVDPFGKYETPVDVSIAMPVDNNAVIKDGSKFDNNEWLKMFKSDY